MLRLMEIKHEEQVCLVQDKVIRGRKKLSRFKVMSLGLPPLIKKNIPIMPAALKKPL